MFPNRSIGDDRAMWRMRRLLNGTPVSEWAYVGERASDLMNMFDGAIPTFNCEVELVVVTAPEWNNMPEFEGW